VRRRSTATPSHVRSADKTLVFSSRYPVLTVGMALVSPSVEPGERIRYTRAWVCRNGACDYRDIEEDSY
jgi:hypothetical protein